MEIKREHHINFWYIILAFMAILFIQDLLVRSSSVKVIPYSEFQTLLQQKQITDIVVGSTTITGKYKKSSGGDGSELFHDPGRHCPDPTTDPRRRHILRRAWAWPVGNSARLVHAGGRILRAVDVADPTHDVGPGCRRIDDDR